ncbi:MULTISPECIES: hypothetical protein [Pasteurellaceae]|uniref:Uncharacterized protein n=1 Tax=Pasteurella atlantica TaxID=2827233 RepID=A0AAW8CKB1_9PAST|nr:hypothetical protein [Pasteurella atlantica]MBR0573671.1 hypothetical protein [Pasteurella atlantica]MDP8039426.1 hypothetical protein [Pasteurella atlantica]MDP8041518.1 hypothetical protein [Pasteurella atlantica]MDP8043557.1 hypothetical protein [Pasteurella atlantica]MDP8045739.1 hypothetical protein [Pasteurella atlantica]
MKTEELMQFYLLDFMKKSTQEWYSMVANTLCIFDDADEYGFYDYVNCFFIDEKQLIIKNKSPRDSFLLLCFLAQKENCKAPDIMQWLSGISSKEEYIQREKYIRKKIAYLQPCSVVFEEEGKDIFEEDISYDWYGPTLFVKEKADSYEIYHDYYPERSNHRIQETVAIIYDKSLLYPYLLNKQFFLLLNRARGELPLLD